MKKLYFVCLMLAALFISGCGDSDGWGEPSDPDPPSTAKLLDGKYFVSQLLLNSDNAAAARMEMNFTVDSVSIDSQNRNYTLDGRSLTIPALGDGIVHKNGNLFTLVDTTNPEIAIFVGIKEGADLSNSTLSGNYVVSEFGDEASTNPNPNLENYTVAANGALAVSNISQERGILDASGDVFTAVNTGLDTIKVGMKKSSSRTTEELAGKYIVNVIGESNAVSTGFFTAQFEMDLDGAGDGTITVVKSSINISGSRTFTYSVESDGSLKYEATTVGIVSPDAQSFTMAINIEDIIFNSQYTGTGFAFGIAKQ